jgi:membrane protein implicated in regulation of membrane protease activity
MRSLFLFFALSILSCNRKPALVVASALASPSGAVTAQNQPAMKSVSGKVVERIDTDTYSYLRLDTVSGEQWAAVPKCESNKGDGVVVVGAMAMDGFESKTLHRKFERIVFGTLQGASVPSAGAGQASPHGKGLHGEGLHGMAQAVPTPASDLGKIAVARATGPNAVTVAELYAKKSSLDGKAVRVHAKVVKVLTGIMGKNWVHVRDGSGSVERSDNDLTVTTQDTPTVGSDVLVEGTAHADKDFGSGYKFAVIVEDAKVTK